MRRAGKRQPPGISAVWIVRGMQRPVGACRPYPHPPLWSDVPRIARQNWDFPAAGGRGCTRCCRGSGCVRTGCGSAGADRGSTSGMLSNLRSFVYSVTLRRPNGRADRLSRQRPAPGEGQIGHRSGRAAQLPASRRAALGGGRPDLYRWISPGPWQPPVGSPPSAPAHPPLPVHRKLMRME